jgi:hypothetical protein
MTTKFTRWPKNIPFGHKINQTAQEIKHLALQDLPKFTQIWIFGLKIYHLAALDETLQVHAAFKKY